jgi:hypothetical protein
MLRIQMADHGSLAKTSLIAALAQVCFGMLAIFPEAFGFNRISSQRSTFDWVSGGLVLFGCLAIAAVLWLVYRDVASLNASRSIGLAALTAAVLLSIENLPHILGTIRNLSHSNDVFLWRTNPLRYASYVLVPAIPSFAVVSLAIFLVLVYRTSLGVPEQSAERRRNWGLRYASFTAFGATIGAMGVLMYAVATIHVGLTWGLGVRLLLRAASIISLGIFFLLVGIRQNKAVLLVETPRAPETLQ